MRFESLFRFSSCRNPTQSSTEVHICQLYPKSKLAIGTASLGPAHQPENSPQVTLWTLSPLRGSKAVMNSPCRMQSGNFPSCCSERQRWVGVARCDGLDLIWSRRRHNASPSGMKLLEGGSRCRDVCPEWRRCNGVVQLKIQYQLKKKGTSYELINERR